jgi:uncharacterized membrane protein
MRRKLPSSSRSVPSALAAPLAALIALGSGAAPLDRDEGAEALNLLKDAHGRRHSYGEAFPGFEAKLKCAFGDGNCEGKVRVRAGGEVEVELPEPEARLWVEEQLSIIISHRLRFSLPEAKALRLEAPGEGRSRAGAEGVRR